MPGQPVHFEIPSDDTEKGRAFWGSLFGWEFQPYPGPFEYHMSRITERTGAAITNMEPGKRGIRTYLKPFERPSEATSSRCSVMENGND